MATGQVTINNAVPYLGELFQTSKRPNTILKLLGGLQGGVIETAAKEFPIGVFYNLRSPAQPAILEGAAAPAAQYRALTQTTNVVQIFHEKVSLSYLSQSDRAISGVVPIPQAAAQGQVIDPRTEAFQVMRALETIAQDANYTFLNGSFANPADPASTAMKTRGIITAITTNVNDHSGGTLNATNYKAWVEEAVQAVVVATGYNPDDTWTIMADPTQFANIQAAYESKTTPPYDRTIAGLKLRQIYTRYGVLNLALDPDMPATKFAILNLGMAGIVGLPVPGKGILFEEPLYKQGSSDETQIYGQMGVDHGPEYTHALTLVPSGSL